MHRLFAATLLRVAACSKSPSSPSQPPASSPPSITFADFSGYWGGTFHYTACGGALKCRPMDGPFSLRLRQTAGHVIGVFAMLRDNIAISGDVQPDGSLALEGSESTGGTKGTPGDATFKAPGLRLDPATGLRGSMRFGRQTFLPELDTASFVADGSIVSATHQSLDAFLADLSGMWTGLYRVQACADQSGRPYCGPFRPDEVEYLELTVAVDGSSASGQLRPSAIPVSGVARDGTLQLAGTSGVRSIGLIERIDGLRASVDEFGRLNGTFHYEKSSNGVLSTADVQFIQVVKNP